MNREVGTDDINGEDDPSDEHGRRGVDHHGGASRERGAHGEGEEDGVRWGLRGATEEGMERGRRLAIASPLSAAEDRVITQVIGCAIAVHRELGPGFLESIYKRAMRIELEARHLHYDAERAVRVAYRGVTIPGQRIDLVVANLIVVELKSVTRFDRIHVAQVISYLKTTRLRGGLLLNFRVPVMMHGIRRVILPER